MPDCIGLHSSVTVDTIPSERNVLSWLRERGRARHVEAIVNSDRSPALKLLEELLASTVVLQEDFEGLPALAQVAIWECRERQDLLPLLVSYGLLTQYQADRVESGKTYGLVLGQYRVVGRLGAGGMGVVFEAEHVTMRRTVAIKVLPVSPGHVDRLQTRFLTEIRIVAQLQHPNIVAAMDAGKVAAPASPALHYFVMEYVPGDDLEEHVLANGPMDVSKACDVIHQVASALAEAHKHALVHRDIKPANVRLTPEGQAKLLDFGLARHRTNRLTEPGTVLGTVDYMAPEQTCDATAVDIRADVYALGGTLFWCLTGRLPFVAKGNIVQEIAARHTQPPPSVRAVRPDVPAELDALVCRMMAIDPGARPQTPHAVMQDLLPYLKPELPDDGDASGERRAGDEPLRGHRILVVDDEPELRRFARLALHDDDGSHCDEAADGVEAVQALMTTRYDLVLLDVDMPDMTGPEVCRYLRQNPPSAHLKVLMTSGRAGGDELARMLSCGADDYLSKPLSVVQLQSKVTTLLRLKDAQDRAALLNVQMLSVNQELEQTLSASSSDLVHTRNGLVRALAKLVECREGEAGAHLERMEQYSRCLAEEASRLPAFAGQIDANFVELLSCCAPLHDIGKVALPDHILMKSGKLDAEERLLMQTHTTAGADTLKTVMERHGSALAFMRMAADIVRHHHERYDGEGYPDALAGEAIPLSARLVALCDVYDALRSRRTYKPALSHSTAVQVMTKVSIGQFDPNLVEAFQRCAGRFEQIFRETVE